MEVAGLTLIKRLALVIDDGAIAKAFYPVFPPDRNAADVHAWLQRASPPMSARLRLRSADDGGARHLQRGRRMPDLDLPTTPGPASTSRRLPAARSSTAIPGPAGRACPTRPTGTTSPARTAPRPQAEGFRNLHDGFRAGRRRRLRALHPADRLSAGAGRAARICRSSSSATRSSRCPRAGAADLRDRRRHLSQAPDAGLKDGRIERVYYPVRCRRARARGVRLARHDPPLGPAQGGGV